MKLLLDDYPYAEDGLLIWNALKKWNHDYLVGLLHVTSPEQTAAWRRANLFSLV